MIFLYIFNKLHQQDQRLEGEGAEGSKAIQIIRVLAVQALCSASPPVWPGFSYDILVSTTKKPNLSVKLLAITHPFTWLN